MYQLCDGRPPPGRTCVETREHCWLLAGVERVRRRQTSAYGSLPPPTSGSRSDSAVIASAAAARADAAGPEAAGVSPATTIVRVSYPAESDAAMLASPIFSDAASRARATAVRHDTRKYSGTVTHTTVATNAAPQAAATSSSRDDIISENTIAYVLSGTTESKIGPKAPAHGVFK